MAARCLGVHTIIAECFEATSNPFEYAKVSRPALQWLLHGRSSRDCDALSSASIGYGSSRSRRRSSSTLSLPRISANELTYGEMDTFHAGLEGFIGPPLAEIESAPAGNRSRSCPRVTRVRAQRSLVRWSPALLLPDSDVEFRRRWGRRS